jgi:hypothetical protein
MGLTVVLFYTYVGVYGENVDVVNIIGGSIGAESGIFVPG